MLPFQQGWQNLLLTFRGDHLSGFADEANISVYLVSSSWACWGKHLVLKMFCAVKILENSWVFPADFPVALVASFVQIFSNKQDAGHSLDSRQPLCWWLYSDFLTFASPATAGDSEHQTQPGNTKGTFLHTVLDQEGNEKSLSHKSRWEIPLKCTRPSRAWWASPSDLLRLCNHLLFSSQYDLFK